MKKQFPFWAKCLLVVAVLAAGYFWYTRPMTLEQICPSFRWAEVTHISGHEEVGDMDAPSPVIVSDTLPINDPYGEAGGIPELAFFAPDQRIDLSVTEYKEATLSSADIDMPLRCTDEALFQDLLDYLRAHPYDPDAQPSVSL